MTREEAIKIFEGLEQNPFLTKAVRDASKIAIEAIHKQIPKPYVNVEFQYIAICSSCGCDILDCNYCKYCGQKIDWKEQRK